MAYNRTKLMEFMSLVGQLKRVKRTGWVLRKVTEPESVADHMYRMSLLAFLADPATGVDKDKCIKMALVHDVAESMVGDHTPNDGVSKEEKHKKELAAMMHICSLVSESVGSEMLALWQEYEAAASPEAKFVKDLDKFEMILQAHEYEQLDQRPGELQEFFDSTQGKFTTGQVQQWVEDLEEARSHPEEK